MRETVIGDWQSGVMGLREADGRIFGKSKGWRVENIASVAFLRKRIARAFRDWESLFAKRVVYNGSHAGDHLDSRK